MDASLTQTYHGETVKLITITAESTLVRVSSLMGGVVKKHVNTQDKTVKGNVISHNYFLVSQL